MMDARTFLMVFGVCSLAASMETPCPSDAKTCSECIKADPMCTWCTGQVTEGSRCALQSHMRCSQMEESTVYQRRVTFQKNEPPRRKRPISPQRIHVTLRKGATATIPFQVLSRKQAVTIRVRHSRALDVSVESKCGGFEWKKKIAKCRTAEAGEVEFSLTVKAKKCRKKLQKIKLLVDGNKKKSLKIKVASVCSCDCEKNDIPNAPQCNSQGDLTCGACSCRPGYYGERCECHTSFTPEEAIARCTEPGHNRSCSGRGQCICGQCDCYAGSSNPHHRLSGQYCQCDDFACDYFKGEMCGGSKRGVCKCGFCQCFKGYEGPACETSLSHNSCISSTSGKICNGHGLCINNQCECIGGYTGLTCDQCSDQEKQCDNLCMSLKPCVQCFAYNTGALKGGKCDLKCGFMRAMATVVEDVVVQERGGPVFRMCFFKDEDDCFFKFSTNFMHDTQKQQIKIEQTKMCPSNDDI